MTERPHLGALAERCGIVRAFVGYDGREQLVADTTRETLLLALGHDASTEALAEHALRGLSADEARPGLAEVRVLPVGSRELGSVQVRLPTGWEGRLYWRIALHREDDGTSLLEGECDASGSVLLLPVPRSNELSPGYHALRCELSQGAVQLVSTQDLIVVPNGCVRIEECIGARRSVGVWGHLYAFYSQHSMGIGDLGDLRRLIDWAAGAGIEFIGINPLHATDHLAREPSPYYPLSRLYRNPIYLDLEATAKRLGWGAGQGPLHDPAVQAQRTALQALPRVDYGRVHACKLSAFEALHRASAQQRASDLAYAAYLRREGQSLRDFAVFCALRESLQATDPSHDDWRAWPVEYQKSHSAAVQAFAAANSEAVDLHAYAQYELDRQLASCGQRCREVGMPLGLYGDLAVGDAPHAGDVWARPELYARGVSIGAPPDAYSASGQTWGITPLHPLALRKDRYRRWSTLLHHAFAHSGVLRIDHVMGLARQFWVPDGATAREGGYVRYPLDDLLGIVALESRRAGALVVGEDLGVVPDGFRERMAHSSVLRSQVLYFERDGYGGFRTPADYARNALVSASTHDLPPVAGFWAATDLVARRRAGNIESDDALERELTEREYAKAALLALLRRQGLLESEPEEPRMQELVSAVNQLLASTGSRLVGVALDDLMLERDALNIPATVLPDTPNWSRKSRIGLEALAASQPIADQVRRIRERARVG